MINERPLSIPVILGTTRQGRMSEHAARFMAAQISQRKGIKTELIDIFRDATAGGRCRGRHQRPGVFR